MHRDRVLVHGCWESCLVMVYVGSCSGIHYVGRPPEQARVGGNFEVQ